MRQMRHLHRCSFIYKLLELLLVLRLTTPEYDRWCDGECEGWRLEEVTVTRSCRTAGTSCPRMGRPSPS